MLGIAGIANAISFTNAIDYSTADKNLDYIIINDSTSGVYTHTINFASEAASIESAFLTITFANANDTLGNEDAKESWLISDESGVQIGSFEIGADREWVTKSFDLSSYKSAVSGSSWTFNFTFASYNFV